VRRYLCAVGKDADEARGRVDLNFLNVTREEEVQVDDKGLRAETKGSFIEVGLIDFRVFFFPCVFPPKTHLQHFPRRATAERPRELSLPGGEVCLVRGMLDDAVVRFRDKRRRNSFYFFLFLGRLGGLAMAEKKERTLSLLPKAVEEALGHAVGCGPAPLQRWGGGEGGSRDERSSGGGFGFCSGFGGVARARRRGRGRGGRSVRRCCFRGQRADGLQLR